jgi:NAD(P)-dependent dehydrogenase (short-subunit alcohol dehydrogenase family)
MEERFAGNAVVVTGAGVGIGFALCRHFAEQGARVGLNDLSEETARQAAGRINEQLDAERVWPYPGDVADVGRVRAIVDDVADRHGRLDVAVANAGITNYGEFLDYTPEAFDRLTAVNLRGSYFTAQAAARRMIASAIPGRIILMSSVTGGLYLPNLGAYGITKAAIRMMAHVLGVELGPYGLTVNAVSPGATITERTLADDPDYDANWRGANPNRQTGRVDDVIAAVAFLASREACHINAQVLEVDGGWTWKGAVPSRIPDKPVASSKLR